MDNNLKLETTLDILFGDKTSDYLPENYSIVLSKTHRIRSAYDGEKLLCTLRPDGGITLSLYFAQLLLSSKSFKENCVQVDADSEPFIQKGKSVFCQHVVWCGSNVVVSSETPIVYDSRIIAIGTAVLPAFIIRTQNHGVAVKVRHSLKSKDTDDKV